MRVCRTKNGRRWRLEVEGAVLRRRFRGCCILLNGKAPPNSTKRDTAMVSLFPSIRSVINDCKSLCPWNGLCLFCFPRPQGRSSKKGRASDHATRLGACSGLCSEQCLAVFSRVLVCVFRLLRDPLNAPAQTDGRSDDATVPATVSARLMQLRCGWKARYVHNSASMQSAQGHRCSHRGGRRRQLAIEAEKDDAVQGPACRKRNKECLKKHIAGDGSN